MANTTVLGIGQQYVQMLHCLLVYRALMQLSVALNFPLQKSAPPVWPIIRIFDFLFIIIFVIVPTHLENFWNFMLEQEVFV